MGFRSDKALHCVKLCTDNHKALQMLKIFYNVPLDELLIPYVRHKIQSGSTPSVNDFVRWCKHCQDPNYLYMHEQFLTYCQALLNCRQVLRLKNHTILQSGKEIFANLFYESPHPKYQYISMFETCDYVNGRKLDIYILSG